MSAAPADDDRKWVCFWCAAPSLKTPDTGDECDNCGSTEFIPEEDF